MATPKRSPSNAKFSQTLFDEICTQMAAGKSLRSICAASTMPNRRTVLRWLAEDDKLTAQYNEAINLRAEHFFDEIVEIADSKADPQKTRVQIDARKWVLARMNPKKYGDKFTQELTGEGGAISIKIVRHGDPDA